MSRGPLKDVGRRESRKDIDRKNSWKNVSRKTKIGRMSAGAARKDIDRRKSRKDDGRVKSRKECGRRIWIGQLSHLRRPFPAGREEEEDDGGGEVKVPLNRLKLWVIVLLSVLTYGIKNFCWCQTLKGLVVLWSSRICQFRHSSNWLKLRDIVYARYLFRTYFKKMSGASREDVG